MVLQMVANSARLAHSTCRDHGKKTGQPVQRFRLLDSFHRANVRRLEGLEQPVTIDEGGGVFAENMGCLEGQRRVDEQRKMRQETFVDQNGEVGYKLLRALHGERWDEKSAAAARGFGNLKSEVFAPVDLVSLRPVDGAVSRFADDVVEA